MVNIIASALQNLYEELQPFDAKLVAVSKTKTAEAIMEAYHCGQRIFGENYVQELVEKQKQLPADIEWHFIGHLQSNKVKYIVPFISLIHGVDSFKLLTEINKASLKINRTTDCLLQLYIAKEETKFGFTEDELFDMLQSTEFKRLNNICIKGLMAMATNTENERLIRSEFHNVKNSFEKLKTFNLANLKPEIISTGMSNDYQIALQEGSNLVRIGSIIFGQR